MEHSDDKEKSKLSAGEPQPKKRNVAKAEEEEDSLNDDRDAKKTKVTIAPYWVCKHVEAIRPFDSSRTGGKMPAQDKITQTVRRVKQVVEKVIADTKIQAESELADFHEFRTEHNRRNVQTNSDSQLSDEESENDESEARTSGEEDHSSSEEDNELVGDEEDSRGKKIIHLKIPNEIESNEMAYFAPIGENVKGNDEMQCRNAPLLGDDTDDMAIGKGIYDKYPNGIHGYEPDKYEFSYQMLFEVMLEMLPSTTRETCELVYYALYHLFPNFGSQEEMAEIFPKLARAFASSEAQLKTYLALEPWKVGVLRSEDTEKKPFDYKHPCSEKHHFVKTLQSSPQNPCSENCFKNTVEQDILLELWIEKSTKDNCDFLNELVLKDDKNIIDNFCEVARKFDDKNCSEWFEFANNSSREHDKRKKTTLPFHKRCLELLEIMKNENLESHESDESPKHNHESQKHISKKNVVSLSPCCHFGPCGPSNPGCTCKELCSVYCQCDYNCSRKFLGCRCTSKGKDCARTDCICVRVGWECVESTCKKCYCDSSPKSCRNNSITKMEDKSISVRKSSIAGNGAFTDEALEEDDFIGLYTGEVLSAEESERRGRLYELGCSYLFDLSDNGISVDAGRAGNALRFVNHGCDEKANCYPIRSVVHGKELIGFFAAKKIKAGEELIFNYYYDEDSENRFFRSAPNERVPVYDDAVAKRVLEIKKDPNQPGTSNS